MIKERLLRVLANSTLVSVKDVVSAFGELFTLAYVRGKDNAYIIIMWDDNIIYIGEYPLNRGSVEYKRWEDYLRKLTPISREN